MFKVLRHGNKTWQKDPVTGAENYLRVVVFIEEGQRASGDAHMAETTDLLSKIAGQQVGFTNRRIHSHPLLEDTAQLYPVHQDYGGSSMKEYEGYINRSLHSEPQIVQQEDVDPQWLDNRPTFIKTWIGSKPEPDADYRLTNDQVMLLHPEYFANKRLRRSEVRIIEDLGPSGSKLAQQPRNIPKEKELVG